MLWNLYSRQNARPNTGTKERVLAEEGAEGSDAAKSSLVSRHKRSDVASYTLHLSDFSQSQTLTNLWKLPTIITNGVSFFTWHFLLDICQIWTNQGQPRTGMLRLPATDDHKSSKLKLAQPFKPFI